MVFRVLALVFWRTFINVLRNLWVLVSTVACCLEENDGESLICSTRVQLSPLVPT